MPLLRAAGGGGRPPQQGCLLPTRTPWALPALLQLPPHPPTPFTLFFDHLL